MLTYNLDATRTLVQDASGIPSFANPIGFSTLQQMCRPNGNTGTTVLYRVEQLYLSCFDFAKGTIFSIYFIIFIY